MKTTKVISYLGFAKKSNQIIYGIDNLALTNKKIALVLICSTVGKNSKKNIDTLLNIKMWQHIFINEKLDDLLNTVNCKIIGITNNDLANAIMNEYKMG